MLKDDEICQCLKFANANFNYLATAYSKRIKIWDLKRISNKNSLKPIIEECIFHKGPVDILDWHQSQNILLTCSSAEKLIKIYSVKEKMEFLFKLYLPNFEAANESNDKLVKAQFIPNNGLIVVKERKAYIFSILNNFSEAYLDLKFDFEHPITNFKIMTNNLNNQYFVYTDTENNFIVRLYTINEDICKSFISASVNFDNKDNRGIQVSRKNAFTKELEHVIYIFYYFI